MNLKEGDLLIFNEIFIKERKERISKFKKNENIGMLEMFRRNLYNIYKVVKFEEGSETVQVQFEHKLPKEMNLDIFKKATELDIKKIKMRKAFSI
jgi:hypothetical protein